MNIQPNEIKTPNLNLFERQALLMSLAVIQGGGAVWASVTYDCQTENERRIAGEDFVAMPGVSLDAQLGRLRVERRVDNAENRRLGVVGVPYLKIESYTRGNGVDPTGYTNMRPEGLTAFAITGFRTGQAQTAQTPQQTGV